MLNASISLVNARISTSCTGPAPKQAPPPRQAAPLSPENTRTYPGRIYIYTLSQPLPNLGETRTLLNGDTQYLNDPTEGTVPPISIPWTPRFLPEERVYTNGSYIKGHPRLGAAVVHIPTRNAIYIDAAGCEETRTIMRAELVAIHTALSTFADHPWIGVFTYSLSILQAIRLHYYKPGIAMAPHYHHHMLLL